LRVADGSSVARGPVERTESEDDRAYPSRSIGRAMDR
jgi:hypothetical protein